MGCPLRLSELEGVYLACFNPLVAYRGKIPNPKSGKLPMVFSPRDSCDPDTEVKLPCGRCIGCRLERSRQWAIRCVHEASLYERNCFITLTFAPEHLPKSGSLNKRDFQLFMKRLRKRFGSGVRYFHCGEYGEKMGRPHYHACLFNFDFDDREHWSTRDGIRLFTSKALQELWPFGFSTIGDVTFESAAYVARYVTKKITGPSAEDHYGGKLPEYITMSRRPGIGRPWMDKFSSDVYPHDRVVLRGREMRPPKFYDAIFELANPEGMEEIKFKRESKSKLQAVDNETARLRTREKLQEIKFKCLKRGYEDDR